MKKYTSVLLSSAFVFLISANIVAQNVCIGINGTTPVVLTPSTKTLKICRSNYATDPVNLWKPILTMNSCGSIPASDVLYQWKNITTGYIAPAGASAEASDVGKWVATVKNRITLVEYTDTLNLLFHDDFYVTVTSNELSFGSSERYCPLTELTLTANTDLPLPTPFTWYKLVASTSQLVTGATGSIYKFKQKTAQYVVVVKDNNGCAASDTSVFFPTDTYFNAELGPDRLTGFCEGGATNLTTSVPPVARASPYYSTYYGYKKCETSACNGEGDVVYFGYTETPTTVDSNFQEKFEPIPITLAPGLNKYFVRLSGGVSCAGTDSVLIYAHPKPVVEIGNDTLLCYDFSLNIKAKILLGTPPYQFLWSTTSTANNITVSPTVATTYTVTVKDGNNCGAGTDSKLVTLNPKIDVTVSNDATICRYPPGTANLVATASGGTGTLTYEWIPNDGLSSATLLTPTAVPVEPAILPSTVYNFFATDDNNCSNPFGAGQPNKVTVFYFKPSLANIVDPVIISESSPRDLNVSTSLNGGYSFSWTTTISSSEISSSPILSLSYNGPDTTYYIITAHSNSDGVLNSCINADTIEVRYISDNILLYVPNVFSPNAMNPENQKLRIYGENLFNEGFKFLIFNKWGNIMYESTDLNEVKVNGWDGGSQVEGVYTYMIVGKFKNGKDVKESAYNKGTFTLVK